MQEYRNGCFMCHGTRWITLHGEAGSAPMLAPCIECNRDGSAGSPPNPPADAADEDGPAPAVVRTALLHAHHEVPVEVIADWTAAQREAAVEYGYADTGLGGRDLPPHLADVAWEPTAAGGWRWPGLASRRGVSTAMRGRGTKARAVMLAWQNGEAATVRGVELQVRDPQVAMEPAHA